MKKSKESIISTVLFIAALLLLGVSFITGLMSELTFSIDKICMYLGFACFGFGLVYAKKAKDKKSSK